ncbi:NAD-dependent epimerase/dehydratase family protein [candidate division KSB1 bacterium]|nr:NAD-dependent epimerase/dehydratase family protein [candidate division KSB1 bacterium]
MNKTLIKKIFSRGQVRNVSKFFLDLCFIALAYYIAFILRFDASIPNDYSQAMLASFPVVVVVYSFVFFLFGNYKGLWRYSSVQDLFLIFCGNTIAIVAIYFIIKYLLDLTIPRSILMIHWLLVIILLGSLRFLFRIAFFNLFSSSKKRKRLLIIGAGNSGEMIARQLNRETHLGYRPIAFVDDDNGRQGLRIHGIPVVGSLDKIPAVVKKKLIDEIIIAAPSATAPQMRRIVNLCQKAGVPYKTLPGPKELVAGHVSVQKVREVRIEDLLERTPTPPDYSYLHDYFSERSVLVTGAAGSIGSELCRQLARLRPRYLILLDQAESDLYELQQELRSMNLISDRKVSVVADITNHEKMKLICTKYKPDVVFHAAAYKHVPLMQTHPEEAVINNVWGTVSVSRAAEAAGAQKFINISTDKAVEPSSVMGATKRISELFCVSRNGGSSLKHLVVRFGNVLGSQGSVIPLFQQQIRNGGPITITSREVSRFFMTIPEAVELVLHAGVIGEGGEVFILDMGEPIKIYDMARHLIALSGFEPEKDIKIRIVGLRPGEKLHEQLWAEHELPQKTVHPKILKLSNGLKNPGCISSHDLNHLIDIAKHGEADKVIPLLNKLVQYPL